MGSTQRNDTSRGVLLARLAVAWDKRPDLTLGQLLAGALERHYEPPDFIETRMRHAADADVIEAIERYVLLGSKP